MNPAARFDLVTGPEAAALADRVATGCFQRPAWVQAVAAARGRPHELVMVRARDDGGRQAWLPGAVHRRFGLSVFEAMPMGGYGGWVAPAPLSADDELQLNRSWLRQAPWAMVELTCRPGRQATLPPAWELPLGPRRLQARLAAHDFTTHLLALSTDEAEQLARVRGSVRSYLRKIAQLGFAFERADDEQALVRMHEWYLRGSRAWRRPAADLLPAAFFTALCSPGQAEVWTVHFHGRAVGAALFLVGRDEVQYQASGVERVDSTLSATDAVVWAAIRHYGQRGLATMNFGASEGLDSVGRFKRKFGAVATGYRRASYLLPRRLGLGRDAGS